MASRIYTADIFNEFITYVLTQDQFQEVLGVQDEVDQWNKAVHFATIYILQASLRGDKLKANEYRNLREKAIAQETQNDTIEIITENALYIVIQAALTFAVQGFSNSNPIKFKTPLASRIIDEEKTVLPEAVGIVTASSKRIFFQGNIRNAGNDNFLTYIMFLRCSRRIIQEALSRKEDDAFILPKPRLATLGNTESRLVFSGNDYMQNMPEDVEKAFYAAYKQLDERSNSRNNLNTTLVDRFKRVREAVKRNKIDEDKLPKGTIDDVRQTVRRAIVTFGIEPRTDVIPNYYKYNKNFTSINISKDIDKKYSNAGTLGRIQSLLDTATLVANFDAVRNFIERDRTDVVRSEITGALRAGKTVTEMAFLDTITDAKVKESLRVEIAQEIERRRKVITPASPANAQSAPSDVIDQLKALLNNNNKA